MKGGGQVSSLPEMDQEMWNVLQFSKMETILWRERGELYGNAHFW